MFCFCVFGLGGFCIGGVFTGFCVGVLFGVDKTDGFDFSVLWFPLFGVAETVGEAAGKTLGATVGEIVAVAVGVDITAFAAGLFEFVEFEP
ncbi:MAG: hypothetical protein LH614_10195, partial [Pyrinomonadaceae bacterium]|nr:hypothetical protein [Pyrinomonadaceae bacterium]